ncbi:MAG: thiamine pyrophosphate-dependent dehydrogenase E1 component subunit alpha [Chloroflexi bacterium]|nr:thiamine pyrophosphate-dependent dehydrogenase E1 component subunit alpha [Chloroflexota bacterium]
MNNASLYRSLFRIRLFEETVLDNFSRGIFSGTTHTCLGQEANAVGVITGIDENDIIFSNHRCHGHYLAYGGDMRSLFAELMGKATGVCGGRGGSQHIHWRNFYTNGVQGGIVPIATGMAYAEKLLHHASIAIAFLGDGTFGEGVIYEAFNIASLWQIPILYVVENNRIAQTTPIEAAVVGSISARFHAFNIPVFELDSSDVLEILPAAQLVIHETRSKCKPQALILNTYRFGPHSKGDDLRSKEYLDEIRCDRDPVTIHGNRLSNDERLAIEKEVALEVDTAYQEALKDPLPSWDGFKSKTHSPNS